MSDWDTGKYRLFENDRTRAARDLLAHVSLDEARLVYDLGCGPGNSTELIVKRFPGARVTGVDSSRAMLDEARKRLPRVPFIAADLTVWTPDGKPDLLFANAVFQWVPDHLSTLVRLAKSLGETGTLAIQMPDAYDEPFQSLIREVALSGPWGRRMAKVIRERECLPELSVYYDVLRPLCGSVDCWRTLYYHALADHQEIVEWMMGTALRPFLTALEPLERPAFLESYLALLAQTYAVRVDGRVLLRMPRLFVVTRR